jgi:hypothetical protein
MLAAFAFFLQRCSSVEPNVSDQLPAPHCGKFTRTSPQLNVLTAIPFLGNLVTAAALGQVSESATTWQVFRKIEYAAGMPQDILSAAREKAEQSDP